MTSRGYVKTQFSWQWYYYTLTPEGVEYLREWLHLPAEVVPETHRKPARTRPAQARTGGGGDRGEGGYRGSRGDRGDREDYRRRDDGGRKDGAPGEFRPQFAGVGRGGPRE